MRLLTRSNFDGLACGALLTEKGIVDEYKFIHPRDIQNGTEKVTANDVLANVPYASGCGMWFAYHSSKEERLKMENIKFEGDSRSDALSAAQVVWDYYGGEKTFGKHFEPLLEAVNTSDSANFSLEEIINAEGWILLSFITDPRTGLEDFGDYRISAEQFILDMIQYCRTKTIDEILLIPDVQERTKRYNEQQILFKDMLRRSSRIERRVVITDLMNEETIYCGNRFIIFASHPDQNIEIRMMWDETKKNVVFSCGHSILNRTSKINVGRLMYKYGGGGIEKAGSCRVPAKDKERVLNEILEEMQKDS